MPRLPRVLVLAAMLVGGLGQSACTTPAPQSRFPDITFRHLPQIRMDVREVAVESEYRSPGTPPNVEHIFPVAPAAAASAWGRDRLVAAGATRRLRYIVRDAAVVETPLQTQTGLTGLLTVDQSERYDLRIAVELLIIADDGRNEGSATARVERSVTVPEDAKLVEREKIWFKLVDDSLKELDGQLEKTVKTVFFTYVVQ